MSLTDLPTLHQRIEALRSTPSAARTRDRMLLVDQSHEPLDAVLQEVNETRFQRLLTFQNNRLEQLTLHVRAGRILKLAAPTSELFLQLHPALQSVHLGDAEQVELVAFKTVLEAFLTDTAHISVRPTIPMQVDDSSGIGLALSREFFENLTDDPEIDCHLGRIEIEEYAAQLRQLSSAYVRIDGDRVSSAVGHDPYRERLLVLAQEELSSRVSASPQLKDQEHFVMMSPDTQGGQSALCAAIGLSVLFVTFRADVTDQVLGLWSECRAKS